MEGHDEPSVTPGRSVWRRLAGSDVVALVLVGVGTAAIHTLCNGQYGFHRDELQTFSNARHLAWGYVEYPPMTAFVGHLELALFGTSLIGFRLVPALAQGVLAFMTGLCARELGAGREAQLVAAVGAVIGGSPLFLGGFLSYTALEFPWWTVVAYFVIRLLDADDPRWWLAIGAALGLGMMTKYTVAFLAAGVAGGMLLTAARRHLGSSWPWAGAALAVLIVLPNLIWQVDHNLVTLDYLRSIHARDIRWGRTDHFLLGQLWKNTHPVVVPLWLAGLWHLLVARSGRRLRMLGLMYVIPLVLLAFLRGRDYYLAPAYPMLMAAGAVRLQQWTRTLSPGSAASVRSTTWWALASGGVIAAALAMPIAPLSSTWWRVANAVNGNFDMEVGWPEMVASVAKIRDSLPAVERGGLGVWAGDDGGAGAVNLYGPAFGLPPAISGMNSNWQRGYGEKGPELVIGVGMDRQFLYRNFQSCEPAGRVGNPYGIDNSTVHGYEDLFVCRHLRQSWPGFWAHFQYYG